MDSGVQFAIERSVMTKVLLPSGTRCRKGFTLIELLVVIAIISLLMTILIPTLNMARKQVRGTVCMAALKQWGLCYHLYAQDHESKLPVFIGGTHQTTYMDSLRPYYADINKMRTCPSANQVATGKAVGEYGGEPVPFIGREEFIANKKAVGRFQDLADAERLEGPPSSSPEN